MLTELTNEQKLNEIYDILKVQESRRKRTVFYKFLKWGVILWVVYFAFTHQDLVFDISKKIAQPILTKVIDTVLNDPDVGIMSTMKDKLLQSSQNLAPQSIQTSEKIEAPITAPVKKSKK